MFSLRTLFLAIAIAAIGAVALGTRSIWWAGAITTLILLAISTAAVAAIFSRGKERAFAAGFFAFGLLYSVVAFSPLFHSFANSLVTTRMLLGAWNVLEIAHPPFATAGTPVSLIPTEREFSEIIFPWMFHGGLHAKELAFYESMRSFLFAGQSLWSFLFGFLGGLIGTYLHRRANWPTSEMTRNVK
jgi:hypothetical protein